MQMGLIRLLIPNTNTFHTKCSFGVRTIFLLWILLKSTIYRFLSRVL